MKQIAIFTYALACLLSTSALAQDCKPDIARQDNISKQQVEVWVQQLNATSFGASLFSTSEMAITATVGRYGNINAVNLVLQKKEESAKNAGFESLLRGAKGSQFYFGFKSGDPVAFTVTEVANNAKVQQGIFAAKGVTTVVLSAAVSDDQMADLRQALTSRQVDGVRMLLTGSEQIDKPVDDKNGRKLMEKFTCFYRAMDSKGVALTPIPANAVPSPFAASASGRYLTKARTSDSLDLDPAGQFSLVQGGKQYGGTYKVVADTLVVQGPKIPRTVLHFVGTTLTEPDGTVWEKQDSPQAAPGLDTASVPQKPTAPALTADQVMQMSTAKIPDDIIISAIQKSGSHFDLTPELMIKLKTSGVSDAVLRAMSQ